MRRNLVTVRWLGGFRSSFTETTQKDVGMQLGRSVLEGSWDLVSRVINMVTILIVNPRKLEH